MQIEVFTLSSVNFPAHSQETSPPRKPDARSVGSGQAPFILPKGNMDLPTPGLATSAGGHHPPALSLSFGCHLAALPPTPLPCPSACGNPP